MAHQPVFDALANHGALLAGDGQHVGIFFGQDFLAKRHVEILCGPICVARIDVAKLKMGDPQAFCDVLGLKFQRVRRFCMAGRHTPVHGKRQRYQRIAKEPAVDVSQRQNTLNLPGSLCVEKISVVVEDIANDVLPT